MIVAYIEGLHREEGASYRELCESEGLCYASFMRWRGRMEQGSAPASRPGPSKVEPLDLDALRDQVQALRHRCHRTAGVGELYRQHRHAISRRDLNQLVREERERRKRERNRIVRRVSWKAPCLIWATDDTEYQPDPAYPKAYLHLVEDLGSRFQFPPLVANRLADGEQVAEHLLTLFEDHGPPLFLKRDNGGNLNHHQIRELLGQYLVIPVNSPCRYPQYNGCVERAQGQLKNRLRRRADQPRAFLAIQASLDIQAENHRKRPALGHRTPCQLFTQGQSPARTYNRTQRREVYDWITQRTLELITNGRYNEDNAWRTAVETWMVDHGFITVPKKQ